MSLRDIRVIELEDRVLAAMSAAQLTAYVRREQVWAIADCSGSEYLAHLWTPRSPGTRRLPKHTENLARAAGHLGIAYLRFSGCDVFSGRAAREYVESDTTDAGDTAGLMQAHLERAVLRGCDKALVVRTGVLFGSRRIDRPDALTELIHSARLRRPVAVNAGVTFSAAYAEDVAALSLDLLIDQERGIWHAANTGARSWVHMLQETLATMGRTDMPDTLAVAGDLPRLYVLGSERGAYLDSVSDALERCVHSDRRLQAVI